MARDEALSEFVRAALANGADRREVLQALRTEGWSRREAREALDGWGPVVFGQPVPRPGARVAAGDFLFHALMFLALGAAATALVGLLHALIDLALPDAVRGDAGARGRVRWTVSVLVVTAPPYAVLAWRSERRLARDPRARRSAMRRWLTAVALLLAAVAFAGDAIAVVHAFLRGELTLRFALKAGAVATVAGLVFALYLPHWRDRAGAAGASGPP